MSVPYVYTMEDLDNPPNPKNILEAIRQIWIQRDTDGQGRCEDCNRMGMDNYEWSRLCPICWRSLPATGSPTQIPDRDNSRIISSDPRENMRLAKKIWADRRMRGRLYCGYPRCGRLAPQAMDFVNVCWKCWRPRHQQGPSPPTAHDVLPAPRLVQATRQWNLPSPGFVTNTFTWQV